ncbi:DUF1569 domain-containing protein [Algibacter sp.]|jgi:hypothetical protein|nr:DUF1569 domain-containing protein [Algibacter sp.]
MINKKITILKNQLSKLESFIPLIDKENPEVSKSTVGWQLDHALKVFNLVSTWTVNSNPKEYKRSFNLWRSVLLPLCYIPRGKARAPKKVLPPETILKEDILNQLQQAHQHIETIRPLPKTAYFEHHVFGKLNKQQTLRFLEMHTKHHLKIVDDILAQTD